MSTSAGRCQQSPPHPYRTLLRLLLLLLPLPRRPPPQLHRPNPTLPPRPRRLRRQVPLPQRTLQNRSDPQRRVRRTDRRSSTTACSMQSVYSRCSLTDLARTLLLWTHLYQYSCFSHDREGLMVTRSVSVPVYLMRRTPCQESYSERASDPHWRGPGSRENRRTVQPWTLAVLHSYYYPSLSTCTCMNKCSTNTKLVVFMR